MISRIKKIAEEDPVRLAMWMDMYVMGPADTHIIEGAKYIRDSELVRGILEDLLFDRSALVREGALYGIEPHLDENAVRIVINMTCIDSSPGIRGAAYDIIEDAINDARESLTASGFNVNALSSKDAAMLKMIEL